MTNNLPIYVADTQALVWNLIGDSKLSEAAAALFESIDDGKAVLILPAVVLAELYMIAEKQRTRLSITSFGVFVEKWQSADNVQLTSLTPDIVVTSAKFTIIPDIFDRLIVTEAYRLNAPLITKDAVITESKIVHTIW